MWLQDQCSNVVLNGFQSTLNGHFVKFIMTLPIVTFYKGHYCRRYVTTYFNHATIINDIIAVTAHDLSADGVK
jgi:hypothetical protein